MERIKIDVELNDGSQHSLVIGNPSLVAWDRTRATRNWPKLQDANTLWMTFIAWHHMKAAGLITCELTEFETKVCVAIADTPEDESEASEQDPTPPVPDPDSLSS